METIEPKQVNAQMNLHPANTKEPMRQFKIVIEKHLDGYVAYPIGVTGAIVGQGETYEEALSNVKSAIACYAEVFGKEMLAACRRDGLSGKI